MGFEVLQYPYALVAIIALGLLFWRPIWGLILITVIFPLDVYAPRLPVAGVNAETVLLGVAMAITLLRFGARVPPLRYSGPVLAFIFIMFVGFGLSIPWARKMRVLGDEPAIWTIFKGFKASTFSALPFFSTYWWFQDERDRRRMLEAISVSVFISAVAGLLDFVFGISEVGSGGRATGLEGDPNGLACAVGAMMFVSLYLAVWARDVSFLRRAFHFGTYLLAFAALLLSLSRGNYVAFVVAHLVFFAIVNRQLFFAALVALMLVSTVAFPLLPSNVRERIEETFSTGTRYRVAGAEYVEASTAYRLVLARVGIDMFEQSPLWGNGLNFFFFHTPEYGAKYGTLEYKDSHNLFIKFAVEFGVLGLAALGWLLFAVVRCGRQLWRQVSDEAYVGAVLLGAATHVLIASLSTTTFLSTKDVAAFFWILFALAARAYTARAPVSAVAPAGAAAVARERWRRFSHRIPAAASQQ